MVIIAKQKITSTIHVNANYWAFLVQYNIALNLPHQYVKEIYKIIKVFSSSRVIFQPSHSQDLMATNNGVYKPTGLEGFTKPLETPNFQTNSWVTHLKSN